MHTMGLLKLCPEGFDESAPSVVEACGRNSKAALEASPEQGTAHDVHLCPGQPSIGLYGRIELQPEVSWHSVAKLIKHPSQRWRLALIKLKAVWAAAASKPWSVVAQPATKQPARQRRTRHTNASRQCTLGTEQEPLRPGKAEVP